jgi:hypothetical protein
VGGPSPVVVVAGFRSPSARQPLDDEGGVPPDTGENVRSGGELEREAHEGESRLVRDDPAVVPRRAVFAEDRQVDPGQIVAEARAPDHVLDVEDATESSRRPMTTG